MCVCILCNEGRPYAVNTIIPHIGTYRVFRTPYILLQVPTHTHSKGVDKFERVGGFPLTTKAESHT